MKKVEFSDIEKQTIVDMYKSGMSAVKIGQIYECSRKPIVRVLHEYGIELDNVLRKIPKTEYQNIINLYNSGKTQKEIASIYGCQEHIIFTIMKSCGVEGRPNGTTLEEAKEMYAMYQSGVRLPEIAKIYGMHRESLGRIFKRYGLATDRKMYHFNENYFDVIDTADKAYILGMFWSDGCNNTKRGQITLGLQDRDKELLEGINRAVESDKPLWCSKLHNKNEHWRDSYVLSLQSRHMSSVLESYGMVPRKSLVLEFPDIIDESLYASFIRGYFDGDGSIYINYNNPKQTEVSMTGTLMFLERVQEICNQMGIKTTIYNKLNTNNTVRTLYITNHTDRIKFLDWIYKDADLKMERKYLKYQQMINNNNINNSLAK
jgi:intein-encoded DNA endonuclease-like protein